MSTPIIVSIRHQIASIIRSEIMTGRLKPGSKINEYSLAKQFGVSRGPVRYALLKLDKEGIVECKDNAGTKVVESLPKEMKETLHSLRLNIESKALKYAINEKNEWQVADLANLVKQIETKLASEDTESTLDSIITFHRQLVAIGGNDLLGVWHSIAMRTFVNFDLSTITAESVARYQILITHLNNRELRKATATLKSIII
ncbi:GntR family transcriptional regulator [Saccharobesus litoralis]|nr:GntR family transcriptional regulator [Saccharobesus litoralis]